MDAERLDEIRKGAPQADGDLAYGWLAEMIEAYDSLYKHTVYLRKTLDDNYESPWGQVGDDRICPGCGKPYTILDKWEEFGYCIPCGDAVRLQFVEE